MSPASRGHCGLCVNYVDITWWYLRKYDIVGSGLALPFVSSSPTPHITINFSTTSPQHMLPTHQMSCPITFPNSTLTHFTFKIMGEPIEIYSDEETAFLAGVKKYWDGLGIVPKKQEPMPILLRYWYGLLRMELRTEFVLQKVTGQIYINQHWKSITTQYTHQLELNQ